MTTDLPKHRSDIVGKAETNFNGDYRTQRVILEICDSLQQSMRTKWPYWPTRAATPQPTAKLAIRPLNLNNKKPASS